MPLTHTRLLVNNFAACFRFYRDVLQMRPTWGDENDVYASFTQNPADEGHALAIFSRQIMAGTLGTESLPPEAAAQDRFMLIVQVDNVDSEIERIRGLGVEVVKEPQDFPGWGYRGAFVRDPDGVLVELSSGLPEEEWSEGLRAEDEKYRDMQV